jgi:excisionase family DNA binding protein
MSKNKGKAKEVSAKKAVTISEAAEINDVTRQAIYVAIKLNKLKAKKESTRWTIQLDDLEAYRKHKYSRAKSTYKGELLFDHSKGLYSIGQVANMLKVPNQKIYYATRAGHLKAHRRGAAWVVHTEDMKQYQEQYLKQKKSKQKAG